MLQDKVRDLQLAFNEIEKITARKIEDLILLTEKELNKLKSEKFQLEAKLSSYNHCLENEKETKELLHNFQAIDESKVNQINNLESQIRMMKESQSQMQRSLDKSKKRERYLESVITHYAIPLPANMRSDRKSSGSSSSNNKSDSMVTESTPSKTDHCSSSSGNNHPSTSSDDLANSTSNGSGEQKFEIDKVTHQMIKQAQERANDVEKELSETKNHLNELFTELDTVSKSQMIIRTQNESLLKQITESQAMKETALQENLKLHNQLEEIRVQKQETDSK
jgi:hypothetical protein